MAKTSTTAGQGILNKTIQALEEMRADRDRQKKRGDQYRRRALVLLGAKRKSDRQADEWVEQHIADLGTWGQYDEEIGVLRIRLKMCLTVLAEVEWVRDPVYAVSYCPICHSDSDDGHKPACQLSAALSESSRVGY